MKKASKLLTGILILTLLLGLVTIPAAAYTTQQLNTADALYQLGLLIGTGTTYALDENLTREQGIVLLVRMLGKEQTALNGAWSHPFGDVPDWVSPYVGYAYENQLTKGISANEFGGGLTMTDQMFLTLCLRAIGYSDNGKNDDFTYDEVWSLAKTVRLTDSTTRDDCFTRGDTAEVFWRLLNLRMKGSRKTLSGMLMEQGVFSSAAWARATIIQVYGRDADDGSGEQQTVVTESVETEPPIPSAKPGSDIETPLF